GSGSLDVIQGGEALERLGPDIGCGLLVYLNLAVAEWERLRLKTESATSTTIYVLIDIVSRWDFEDAATILERVLRLTSSPTASKMLSFDLDRLRQRQQMSRPR